MTKKKISGGRAFSFQELPQFKVKGRKGLIAESSRSRIQDTEMLFKALWECLVTNDIDSFKTILQTYLEATNKEALIKKARISRRTLYRMLSPEGNPTLENIGRILHALAA